MPVNHLVERLPHGADLVIGRLQQLLDEHGKTKSLPAGFKLQALLASSHYPELETVNICFLISDVNIPLSSRQNGLACSRMQENGPIWSSSTVIANRARAAASQDFRSSVLNAAVEPELVG